MNAQSNLRLLQRGITLTGSQSALARQLGVSHTAVRKWLVQGFVPTKRERDIRVAIARTVVANRKIEGCQHTRKQPLPTPPSE